MAIYAPSASAHNLMHPVLNTQATAVCMCHYCTTASTVL